MKFFYFLFNDSQGRRAFFFSIVQSYRFTNNSIP